MRVLQLEREAALHTFKDSLGGVGMPVDFALPEHVSLHGLCLSLSQETPFCAEELHGVGKYREIKFKLLRVGMAVMKN